MSSLVCGKAQPVSLMSVLLVRLVSVNDKARDMTQQQLPHPLSLSARFSQHEFSMCPTEVGFLTIPPSEPMTILMIDHSPLDCGEREESRPQSERIKRRGRKEGRGQSHKVRVMSSLLFSVVRPVACAATRGQAE